jgi:hypothetical protein
VVHSCRARSVTYRASSANSRSTMHLEDLKQAHRRQHLAVMGSAITSDRTPCPEPDPRGRADATCSRGRPGRAPAHTLLPAVMALLQRKQRVTYGPPPVFGVDDDCCRRRDELHLAGWRAGEDTGARLDGEDAPRYPTPVVPAALPGQQCVTYARMCRSTSRGCTAIGSRATALRAIL